MGKKAAIAIYIVIMVLPLVAGLGYSLCYSLGLTGIMNHGFTLEHWKNLWHNSNGLLSLAYSFYLTLVSLVLILLCALFVAWRQNALSKGKLFLKTLFLPLTFPPLIAAFAWYYLLSPAGIVSRLFYNAGITQSIEAFPRLVNDTFGIGILITHLFLVFPLFAILFTHQAKKERMDELKNISLTLGSSERQFLWKVFIPFMLKKSSPLIVLYGIFLLGTYEVPLLLGQSSPRTVSIFITEKMTRFNLLDIPTGHAMAVVYSLIVILTTSFLLKNKKTNLFEV